MKGQKIIRGNISSFFKVMLFLLLVFNNETLANNLCSFVYQPTQYVVAIILICVVISSISQDRFRYFNKNLCLAAAFLVCCIGCVAVFDSARNGYNVLGVALIATVAIVSFVEIEDFALFYIDSITCLSVYSLVCTYVLKFFTSGFGVVSNSSGVSFYNYGLCYVHIGNSYYRNFGLFREPGVFAYFICMAIVLLLTINTNNENRRRDSFSLIVLIITLISTFSTTGYLALAVIIVWLTLIKKNIQLKTVCVLLALTIIMAFFTSRAIENPLSKLNKNSSSFQFRIETVRTAMGLIVQHPLGLGINKGLAAMKDNYGLPAYHNTNTWTTLGVYLGVPYMLCSLAGFWKFSRKVLDSVLLFMPFLLLLSGELLIYDPFFYVFVLYGFSVHNIGGKSNEGVSD